jgi:hypothetical protein
LLGAGDDDVVVAALAATVFHHPGLFPAFALPLALPPTHR